MPPIDTPSSTLPRSERIAPILMLCPLLAVSDSVLNALGFGLVAMLVAVLASLPMSMTLQGLPQYGRIVLAVAVIAGVVTSALLMANAYFHDLYLSVGAYLPLFVASGLLLARFDMSGARERRGTLILAALRTGAAFAFALLCLGAARELVGHGSLLFGAGSFAMQLFHPDKGFVLAALPPGAFIAMGLLFALRNAYQNTFRRP